MITLFHIVFVNKSEKQSGGGGVYISRSEVMRGAPAGARFGAGFVPPVIPFDVDLKPSRM